MVVVVECMILFRSCVDNFFLEDFRRWRVGSLGKRMTVEVKSFDLDSPCDFIIEEQRKLVC